MDEPEDGSLHEILFEDEEEGYIYKPTVKPFPERRLLRMSHGRDTICSNIRDMFCMTHDEKIRLKCRVAMRMSKEFYTELQRYYIRDGGKRRGELPYKRRTPVDEEEMKNNRYVGHHSICQTLREIWGMTDNDEIKLKCRLGVAMAKAMNEKLKYYKAKELTEQT